MIIILVGGGRARYTSPSLPLVVIIIIKNREFNSSFSTSLSISECPES
jgi:hypothetical protein